MNVEYVLQKIDPFLFFLLAFIILFELESREECPFKCIKYADRNNQSNDTICLIQGLFIHIIIFMHILEHLNGSRTHRDIHILQSFLIGPDYISAEPLQIVFNDVQISLNTFFSLAHFILFGDIIVEPRFSNISAGERCEI